MKRFLTFSMIAALLAFTVACSNGLAVVTQDENSVEYAAYSKATITITGVERNLLPDDWTDARLGTLNFHLAIKDNAEEAPQDTQYFQYTYAQVKAGLSLTLVPANYDFTLTAVKGTLPDTAADLTTPLKKAIVLQAVQTNVDLTASGQDLKMTLKPKYNTDTVEEDEVKTEAKGELYLDAIFTPTDNLYKIKQVILKSDDPTYADALGTDFVKEHVKGGANAWEPVSGGTTYKVVFQLDNVPCGKYWYGIAFYQQDGKLIQDFREKLIIDGANRTTRTVDFNKVLNEPPAQPTTLTVETNYATQKIKKGSDDYNADKTAASTYTAKFTWDDVADFEKGYQLVLVEYGADKTLDTDDDVYHSFDATTTVNATATAAYSLIAGDLKAGGTTATVLLETAKLYKAYIRAYNWLDDVIADADLKTVIPAATTKKKDCETIIGMYSVTYYLMRGYVVETSGPTTKWKTTESADNSDYIAAYVVGWNYADTPALMVAQVAGGGNDGTFPRVAHDSWTFNMWISHGTETYDETAKIHSLTKPDIGTTAGAAAYKNQEYDAIWGIPVSIAAEFPTYAKDQLLISGWTENEARTYEIGDSVVLSALTGTAVKGLGNVTFTLYNCNGGAAIATGSKGVTITTGDSASFTWNTGATGANVEAGIYRVNAAATYNPTGKSGDTGYDATKAQDLSQNVFLMITN